MKAARGAMDFWNSPAYQALLSLQQQVETEQELEARRAQLNALMARVAREGGVAVHEVRAAVHGLARAGLLREDGGGGG
ncbi:MAG: hypothetical protein ACOYO0_13590, partial [Sandarakinorhabdus sp.]